MVTANQCFLKWGDPATRFDEGGYMILWDIPAELEIGVIPKKLYCNKLMIPVLTQAFKNLIERGYVEELKTFDGCFNIRPMRNSKVQSLHSWGIAIDLNAAWNQLYQIPKLSPGFIKCFTDAGMDWGGNFKPRTDGMHFQLSKI